MVSRRAFLALPPALAVFAASQRAQAAPRVGAPFPAFSARDLTDRWHQSRELAARRTFVTVLTGTGAADQIGHWLNNAEARFGRGGPIVSLVALDVGFPAWDGIVWDRARAGTPRHRHRIVWLDRNGSLQRALGLPSDARLPWAYVVDRGGIVTAAHHGIASDPQAQSLWAAMAAP